MNCLPAIMNAQSTSSETMELFLIKRWPIAFDDVFQAFFALRLDQARWRFSYEESAYLPRWRK